MWFFGKAVNFGFDGPLTPHSLVCMSLNALKKEVRELSVVERIELADYIAKQDQASEEARRARIERRMKSLDRGRKFTSDQLMAVHQAMKAVGL